MNKSFSKFKKRVGQTAIALTIVVGSTIAANAASTTGITIGSVNFREGASIKTDVITKIDRSKTVEILGETTKYYKVKYEDKTGYVSKNYVRVVENYNKMISATSNTNVRKGPSTINAIIGQLKTGQEAKVLGKYMNGDYLWYKVEYKGQIGYVSSKYVKEFYPQEAYPTINVKDVYSITVKDDFRYSDLNATAKDADGNDLTNKIQYSGKVKAHVAGNYEVILEVTDDNGNTTKKSVTVVVGRNLSPEISIKNDDLRVTYDKDGNILFNVIKGDKFDFSQIPVTASDVEDGKLEVRLLNTSDKVNMNVTGKYELKLQTKDSKGATTNMSVFVRVNEPKKPVIKAEETIYVLQGSKFDKNLLIEKTGISAESRNEYTANYTQYKNITSDIKYLYLNKVNTNVATPTAGTYKVGAAVKDAYNQSTYKNINVVVVADTKPVIKFNEKVNLVQGNKFHTGLLGIKAYDPEVIAPNGEVLKAYEDLTSQVTVSGKVDYNTPGTYTLTLQVKDSFGTVVREYPVVNVKANRETVIDSKDTVYVSVGHDVKDFKNKFAKAINLKATDYEDNDLTSEVVMNGLDKVNTDEEGTFKVILSVTDKDGVTVKKAVTVRVVEKIPANLNGAVEVK